MFVHILDS